MPDSSIIGAGAGVETVEEDTGKVKTKPESKLRTGRQPPPLLEVPAVLAAAKGAIVRQVRPCAVTGLRHTVLKIDWSLTRRTNFLGTSSNSSVLQVLLWCFFAALREIKLEQLNIEKIHITKMGAERIKRNLDLDTDPIGYCKQGIKQAQSIERRGKNWYAHTATETITINAHSHTIITAHKKRAAGTPQTTQEHTP